MGTKRFAEYRMINDPQTAGLYRKSFQRYTQETLLCSSVFYGLCATFCLGIFMIKYRVEYVIAIPILLVSLKLVKKDPKCIFSTISITMAIYTVVHFINLAINDYCIANNILDAEGNVVFANYMYSLAPNNPLVELFIKLIPGGYWHMYLAVPILVVYLLIVYTPDLLKKKEKCAR